MKCGQAPAELRWLTPRMHPPLLPSPLAENSARYYPRQVARLSSAEPGTMPATWAELHSCLAALLDQFTHNSSAVVDVKRVCDATARWQALTDDLLPLPPDDAERTELLG